jgi:hypothetical protein
MGLILGILVLLFVVLAFWFVAFAVSAIALYLSFGIVNAIIRVIYQELQFRKDVKIKKEIEKRQTLEKVGV